MEEPHFKSGLKEKAAEQSGARGRWILVVAGEHRSTGSRLDHFGNGDGIQGSESPVLIELCMILRRQLRFGIRQTSVAFNALAESLDTCT